MFYRFFLALLLYRYMEKDLDSQFTTTEIVSQLKDMNFYTVPGQGFIATYTRTDFTDALHDTYRFRTDYQIVSDKEIKKIYRKTKK